MSIIGEFHQFGAVLRHASRDGRVEKMMNGLPRELQVELGWIEGPSRHGTGTAGQLHKYGRVALLMNKLPLDIQIELGWPVGPLASMSNVIAFDGRKARCA
ncbi:hypothetical protein GGQ99_000609 [Aminobacter niigataensis]|uniref:Uncharacterized protein n=1 Tax=Aminobacter niigataensis TaxID=83265 RepID=A0ABR6KWH8_9HYPH|nr:hypothetical protein [Aminobacter niigataensis]MBB4648887.1 hypothetical protein [Aminobacter niigataensis]